MGAPPSALHGTDGPFRGLVPFTEADEPYFFGREREGRLIANNLLASPLTVLYGESGVGKSSVLRARVGHDLRREAEQNVARGGPAEHVVVLCSSWLEPAAALRARIAAAADALPPARDGNGSGEASLVESLRDLCARAHGRALVILDQFEDYFVYHPDGDADGFAGELVEALGDASLRVRVLISIRADAVTRLDRFKGQIPDLLENRLELGRLDRDAARDAIVKPVARFAELEGGAASPVSVDPELTRAVLADVAVGEVVIGADVRGAGEVPLRSHTAVETPYLQLVMSRLWSEEAAAGSRTIRLATLQRLGGAARIVHSHVDDVMRTFAPQQRDLAAGIFRQLVTASGATIAHTAKDLTQLCELPQEQEGQVEEVLAKLAAGDVRILRPVEPRPGRGGANRFELFHDVLADAVLDWRARYAEAQRVERVEERRREAEAARHRQLVNRYVRVIALVLVAALIGMAALTVYALHERNRARAAERSARANGLAATASAQLRDDAELSVLLAREAMRTRRTRQATAALVGGLSELYLRNVMRGHRAALTRLPGESALSPDGRRLLTASYDGRAAIWDLRSGRALHWLSGHRGTVRAGGFSADGARVLTAGDDGTARIWDAATGRSVHVLRGHGDAVDAARFSPNGRQVATAGGADRTARVWSASSGELLHKLSSRGTVRTVAYSPRGDRLVTGESGHGAQVWATGSGRRLYRLGGHHDEVVEVAFDRTGRRIVTASWDGTAQIWNARGPAHVATLHHLGFVESAGFSPDGRMVVTTSGSTAKLWRAATGRRVASFTADDTVSSAAVSHDGRLLVVAGADQAAHVFDIASRGELRTLRGHTATVSGALFTPSDGEVVTVADDATARTWDVSAGTVLRGHSDIVTGTAFSADGRYLATASGDGTARVWTADGGRAHGLPLDHGAYVSGVAFSPDGSRLATAGEDGTAWVWDLARERRVRPFKREPDPMSSAVFSTDGTTLLTSNGSGVARLWDLRSGRSVRAFRHGDYLMDATFGDDGRLVATAGLDGTARIWQRESGRLLHVLRGHGGGVNAVSFSHDGKFVATASDDRTAGIWDVRTGRRLAILRGHTGRLLGAVYTGDDRRVVTAGDNSVRVWSARDGRPLGVLRMHASIVGDVDVRARDGLIASAGDDRTARLYRCHTCGSADELLELAAQRVTRDLTRLEKQQFGVASP